MKYEIKVKRCQKGTNNQYFQSFFFEGTGDETVSSVLDHLNTDDDLFDIDGNPADKIIWSCSCNQGICGACSMVINGMPLLACKTKLNTLESDVVILEPLTKFPVIADLSTDRTEIYSAPIVGGIWNSSDANYDKKKSILEYEASKCMKCGICVEVCPNTDIGSINGSAVFAVDCYLSHALSSERLEKKRIKKSYSKKFASRCSKSMACMDNCPAKIDLRKLVNDMNKLSF